MAEVVGIISAVLGVLDVSTRGSQRLHQVVKAWINAPAEILALHNEIVDLRYLLDNIRDAQAVVEVEADAQGNYGFVTALRTQLRRAEEHFQSLNGILDELSKIKKYRKKTKWICRERRVEQLKNGIRLVREHINNLLQVHNMYVH